MKLLAILSLDEYANDLHALYRDHKIKVFSEIDIRGYPLEETDASSFGWFGNAPVTAYSTLAFAFLEDAQADALMEALRTHSRTQDADHPVRAFLMPVEQAI